jgi:siroheme synthase-like protein
MKLYPVHLQLEGKQTLVVGGGPVAAMKANALLQGGANVRVIATALSDEMNGLAGQFALKPEVREFVPNDLDNMWLVVGATDSPEVHRQVFEEATRRNILVCIVDDPKRSNFIVPAVLRRGDLLVTVSTSGIAPALAARLRDFLGEVIDGRYGEVLAKLQAVREHLRQEYPDFAERRRAWYQLLDSEVLPALRRGEVPSLQRYDREVG